MYRSMKLFWTVIILTTLSLLSCKVMPPKQGNSIDQMQAIIKTGIKDDGGKTGGQRANGGGVPSAVTEALMPSVTSGYQQAANIPPSERRFNVSANKMQAKAFFMGLVEGTPYNMIVGPNVSGEISLNLKNVTINEAMEAVRDIYGFEYRRTSYGYEVLPQELRTQMFTVNYLAVTRTSKSVTILSPSQISDEISSINVGSNGSSSNGGGSSPGSSPLPGTPGSTPLPNGSTGAGSSVDTRSTLDFWKELTETLKAMMGPEPGHSVVVNAQGGVVIVKAFPSELHRVARYLDRLQGNLEREVIIEAKVLEVQLDHDFEAGIDWSMFGRPNGAAGAGPQGSLTDTLGNGGVDQQGSLSFPSANLNDFNSIFTLNIRGNFGALIKLLQTQGNVQVLSSPRISTVNNQKAVIKVGQDEFFVTSVSTTNTIVGTNTLPSQDVGLTPFFSGITLDVTPQIAKDGMIILQIHPSVSAVQNQQKQILVGSTGSSPNILSLPLALSTIRESDSIVRAKNGQIVVLGGLMQNNTVEEIAEVPVLGRIPFIGAAFRRTSQVAKKSELVILLRPIIVDKRTWSKQLHKAGCTYQKLHRPFHLGGYPDVFGDEAELTDT